MEWTLRTEPSGHALTDTHQTAFETVADLYHHQNPAELSTFQRRAEQVEPWFPPARRAAVVARLRAYMETLGAPAASLQLLEKLLDPRSVAVVTGQQAGLFTGPMYAIHKALSAIGLAEQLEASLQRPVVPVFWVASEDHDWGEVNHAYILDSDESVRMLRLSQEVPLHQMVYHTRLMPGSVEAVLTEAHQRLPEAPYKADVLNTLRQLYDDGMTMSDWFARQLLSVLGERGIVLIDPCVPGLRELAAPVWKHALEQVDAVQDELEKVYRAVEARGFQPVVVRDADHSTVFYVEDGKRYVLERTRSGFLGVRGRGIEKTVAEWVSLAEEEPTRFSANVLLRPVVQDHLLPTLAYVGGPAELAYHPLSGAVFQCHGRSLPPLLLRHRVRLVPPTVRRHMAKWGLTLEQLSAPLNVSDWLRTRLQGSVLEDAVAQLKSDTEARWRRWIEQFDHVGPQIRELTERHIARELEGIERVARKTKRQFELQHAAELRQLNHVNRWLWTDGHPQERRLSPLNVWTRYGLEWLVSAPFWRTSPLHLAALDVSFE